MHLATGLAVALVVSSAVWATPGLAVRWLIAITAVTAAIIVAGTVFGVPLYPWSDLVTLAFGLFGGVLLGRTYPPSQRAFLVLLIVLSVLDVAQNLVFSGPPPSSTTPPPSTSPDPHFIWLNFRIPLPSGHLNIGFADLVLIAAMTEHLRRNQAHFLSLVPGVMGVLLAELVFTLHKPTSDIDTALVQSLIPYLTLGWVATVSATPLLNRSSPAAHAN